MEQSHHFVQHRAAYLRLTSLKLMRDLRFTRRRRFMDLWNVGILQRHNPEELFQSEGFMVYSYISICMFFLLSGKWCLPHHCVRVRVSY